MTPRYYYTPIRMATIQKNLIIPYASEDGDLEELSFIASGSAKWYSYFGNLSI